MSLAVYQSRPLAFGLDAGVGRLECGGDTMAFSAFPADAAADASDKWLEQQEEAIRKEAEEKRDGQFDIWASIQSSKKPSTGLGDLPQPYVHPLVRRSASSLSQKSLEICTESLGSETGSDGFSSDDDVEDYFSSSSSSKCSDEEDEEEAVERSGETEEEETELVTPLPPPPPGRRRRELAAVNYHCSIGRRSPPRSFPPPLPSISRRDGPCLSMRPHRRDGRLVVEAVRVPSQNYLHVQRQDGCLLLTFIDTTFEEIYPKMEEPAVEQLQEAELEQEEEAEAEVDDGRVITVGGGVVDEEEMGEEEEAVEEVEVVDRGIVVEVKVSRPPAPQSGGMKVQRSSVVINKFLGGTPLSNQSPTAVDGTEGATVVARPQRLAPNSRGGGGTTTSTTTATAVVAAAAAASSSVSTDERYWRNGKKGSPQSAQRHPSPEKLFFTSKRTMNRQELVHQVRRCSQHLRPLFIWEPCCIATS